MGLSTTRSAWTYKAKKLGILFFFIAYFVVQCSGQMNSPRGEYFPVFSWSLFTRVINPEISLETEVIRIGDTVFPEPVNYFELDEYFPAARSRSSDVLKTAVQMSRRGADSPEAGAAMRRVFEQRYLSGHGTVEYQLVVVKFDPVARWRTGEVIERRVVGRFTTGEGQ